MEYREIIAVTGLSGLYHLLASKTDGAIVRSLEDQSTRFVSSRVHNFTPLESIEVFTTGDNVSLAVVFKAMEDHAAQYPVLDGKADGKALKEYFKKIFPSLDEERVYVSDMKKMVKWYAQLKAHDLLKFDELLSNGTGAAPADKAEEKGKPAANEIAAKQPSAEKKVPKTGKKKNEE